MDRLRADAEEDVTDDELGASIDMAEIVSASAADLGVDVDANVLDHVGTLGELVDHLHERVAA